MIPGAHRIRVPCCSWARPHASWSLGEQSTWQSPATTTRSKQTQASKKSERHSASAQSRSAFMSTETLAEIAALRARIAQLEGQLSHQTSDESLPEHSDLPLSLPEYRRYGRQMILDDLGLPGPYSSITTCNIDPSCILPHRTNKAQKRIGPCRWGWWTGLSSIAIPRSSWSRYNE